MSTEVLVGVGVAVGGGSVVGDGTGALVAVSCGIGGAGGAGGVAVGGSLVGMAGWVAVGCGVSVGTGPSVWVGAEHAVRMRMVRSIPISGSLDILVCILYRKSAARGILGECNVLGWAASVAPVCTEPGGP